MRVEIELIGLCYLASHGQALVFRHRRIRPRPLQVFAGASSSTIAKQEQPVYDSFLVNHVQLKNFQARSWDSKEVEQALAKAGAVSLAHLPSKQDIVKAIPPHCFEKNTLRSLKYAFASLIATLALGSLGAQISPVLLRCFPRAIASFALPFFWVFYAVVTGTVSTGLWVVAHECGHNAFSDNKRLQTAVGYFLHSCLLVPYFSWQRTHSIHHLNTNHMTEGETHVPVVAGSREADDAAAMQQHLGRNGFAILALLGHLLVGWPAYILQGVTGGFKYGRTSHFWPFGHGGAKGGAFGDEGKELFGSSFLQRRVLLSDLGIAAAIGGLCLWAKLAGAKTVALLYGGPLLVTNAWLVLYTWLQHTSPAVAHFDGNDHNFVRGAFQTIDRPYGRILNMLHHGIGSTHVAHHLVSSIPHYHAWEATRSIRKQFPALYRYDPTPIHRALWQVSRDCVFVEKIPGGGGEYVWAS